ncbi:SMI1/KNR4 family protein [Streptosporangium sp. NBC_01810]|uniref:SMI1/KNR4 family protein n=1 Tax=Streptosporangium sp. NBC_01810 TaxID=2975951 RepID=UPI002DD9BE6F|nr:SMI1/KNR4 family protein [Streptosporangium sp. NBC_01810]WSA22999.1 SMI1/KNR4 family protein [Streptosporangium sp. NBC_01810]
MLRLITSRRVRLALAAGVLAAVVVVVVRLWRRPEAGPRGYSPIKKASIGSPAEKTASGAGRVPRWPPAPLLGVPTEEDLRRYAVGPPSAFRSAVERTFARRSPHEPLDGATRGRLARWGVVGIGLFLLAFGTQVLENAVFSEGTRAVEEIALRSPPDAKDGCEPGQALEPGIRYPAEEGPVSRYTGSCRVVVVVPDSAAAAPAPPDESVVADLAPPPDGSAAAVPDAACRPQVGVPRVRAIDPRVTGAVNRQWRRIERWLAANAPESLRTLGRPARARTIAVAEAQMGLRFPDDLRASLLRHDGARLVDDTWPFGFIGNRNQGVRGIRDTWRRLCGTDGEDIGVEVGIDSRAEWWDGRMIPFGANGSGDHLVIDSVARDVGRTDHEGRMSFTPGGIRIRSYYGLLKATANALETGGSVGHWKPKVTGGELDWDVVQS